MCANFLLYCPFYQSSDRPSKSFETGSNNSPENPPFISNSVLNDSSLQSRESDYLSQSRYQTTVLQSPEESNAPSGSSICDTSAHTGGTLSSSLRSDNAEILTISSRQSSPFYCLRKDSATFVSQILERGRKNLWQLSTSRLSVLLSCPAVCSTSIHNFLRNYEDLKVFILAGEAFCGTEAFEFRQKLKTVCESYFFSFHRQNISVRMDFFSCFPFISFLCQFLFLSQDCVSTF